MPTMMPEAPPLDDLDVWRRRATRRVLAGFAALLGVMGYGVLGYLASGWSFIDALYMVVITVTTVGYGEVRPMDDPWLRLHTILLIALGTLALAYTVGGFVQAITEGEIQRLLGHQRVRRRIDTLQGHTIVAGYGRMGSLVCADLAAAGEPFVLIERSGTRGVELESRGYLHVVGDATEEEVLRDAGIDRARALVTAIPSDADSVFITLTARQMNPEVMIVARAEQPTSVKKLRQAGADHVVLPASIGAHRITSLLSNPSAVEFAELVTQRSSLAIEMAEVPVAAPGPLEGLTLRDADIGRRTGVIVIAVKRADGRVEFPPQGDEPFAIGDSIVLIGRRENLEQFRTEFRG